MISSLFILLYLLFPKIAHADWWKEFQKGLLEASKASKKDPSVWYSQLKIEEPANYQLVPLCVDCPEIFSLTRAVNQILLEQEYSDLPPESILPEEIGKLEAMYVLTQIDTENCEKQMLGRARFSEKDWHFNEMTADLIFSEEFSTGKIGAIHILDQKTRIYIYRVVDQENNKIVKIIVTPDGVAHISFWLIKPVNIPVPILKIEADQIPKQSISQVENEYFRLRTGPEIKMNNGVPEDLFLLDFQLREEFGHGFSLESKSYLSARNIQVRAAILGNEGQEHIYIMANDSGTIRVGVPFAFNIPSLEVNGEVASTPNAASTELQAKVFGINTGVLTSNYDYKKQNLAVEHVTRPTDRTRFSIRYENNASEDEKRFGRENSIWIRFGGSWD